MTQPEKIAHHDSKRRLIHGVEDISDLHGAQTVGRSHLILGFNRVEDSGATFPTRLQSSS
jgi:hypothetical protein